MRKIAKLALGVAALGAAGMVTGVAGKLKTIKKLEDDKNYGVAETLILSAEKLALSDEGKQALEYDVDKVNKDEALITLNTLYVMYDEAEKYLAKITKRTDEIVDKTELLVKRKKNIIKNRRIILNK